MMGEGEDFFDFVAFWEFFNPFKDKKRKEAKPTSKIIKKVYDINSLIRDLGNENRKVADSAQETLERLGEVSIPSLVQALGNEKLAIRGRATWSLIHIGKAVVIPVIEALKNKNPEVRFYAACILQVLRDERAIEPLVKVDKEDKNLKVAIAASWALLAIQGSIVIQKGEIKINRCYDSKHAILNYFGRESLRVLFSDCYSSENWGKEKESDRQERAGGCKIIKKKNGLVVYFHSSISLPEELFGFDEEEEFLFSREEDTQCVAKFLDTIGNCLVFDMNQNLKEVFDKYWSKECDEEIKKFYYKYGFFSDSMFPYADFLRNMLHNIIGGYQLSSFYSELEEKANTFEITWSGSLQVKTVRSRHIPELYVRHLKFKWGLKPEIYHKNCIQCGNPFNPFYLMDPFKFSYQKNGTYSTLKVPEFIMNYYPIESSIKEVNFCPKDLPIYFSRKIYDEFSSTEDVAVKESIKNKLGMLLKSLVDTLGFIPERNFHGLFYLRGLNKQKFEDTLKILNEMPSYNFGYKEIFGSWLKALDAAGVLDGGVRKTSRGYICLAKDGHECRSIGEKIIDDYLFTHNISHEQEPHYPGERQFRADWKVGEYFIEFWGLKGDEDYDKKIEDKKSIAQQHQISLIEITFDDLRNLERKFKEIIVK